MGTVNFDSLDPYTILGIAPSATFDEVKIAYRRTARRLHPDVNHNNPGAAVQFQQITAAYELLIDAERRRDYDKRVAAQAGVEAPIHFTLRVTPSKRRVGTLNEPQVIYLLAESFPDSRASKEAQRTDARLNLCLVLDRSNSMNGPRMNQVKIAAHQIIDQLAVDDVLSVVAFNDRAEVIIPATTCTDKASMKARISLMNASGGTEIYQGLEAAASEVRKFLAPRLINHIVLLTDGNTFGDADRALMLSRMLANEGISVSAMGLGQEWNDQFIDELVSASGGSSTYINSAGAVVRFLNNHVRGLSNIFADRMYLTVAPDPDVKLEMAFRLQPSPQPLDITQGMIPLGNLQRGRSVSVLMQFELPPRLPLGFRSVARMVVSGDVLGERIRKHQALSDISLEITKDNRQENPPTAILDALGKLTLYRMQERANQALENGDVREATRNLENLATRLAALGEGELAAQARAEAQQAAHTAQLTERGRKALKYQTRHLIAGQDKANDDGSSSGGS